MSYIVFLMVAFKFKDSNEFIGIIFFDLTIQDYSKLFSKSESDEIKRKLARLILP
jgi:hypothetical protein